MALIDRIGVDVGRKLKLEDAIEWLNQQLDTHSGLSPSTDTHKQQQR